MGGWRLLSIGTALAAVDLAVPYLLLRESASWASYAFWIVLTVIVISAALLYVRGWGET
jgi:hypothetical protein